MSCLVLICWLFNDRATRRVLWRVPVVENNCRMLQWYRLLNFSPETPVRLCCFYFCTQNSSYFAGVISIHLYSQTLNPLVQRGWNLADLSVRLNTGGGRACADVSKVIYSLFVGSWGLIPPIKEDWSNRLLKSCSLPNESTPTLLIMIFQIEYSAW